MKAKHLLLLACAVVLAGSCTEQNPIENPESILKVQLNAVSDIMSRSTAATAEENKVNTFDVFVFDAETGMLETYQQNVAASAPTAGNLAGELKVGEVTFTLTNKKNKNILAVANAGYNVTYPYTSVGSTYYNTMLDAVAKMNPENQSPSTPFVMSGYVNGVNSTANNITVTMRRRVAKITVVNRSENDGLVITGLQLKQAVNQAYLFKSGHPKSANDLKYIDYNPITVSGTTATLYTYPQPAASNNMTLTVSGTLAGAGFTQTIDVLPLKDGVPQDMNSNTLYTIDITADDQTITADITTQIIEEWSDGSNISGAVTMVKGTAGSLTWTLTADSTLTISGEGEIPYYPSSTTALWHPYREQIKTVTINNGVTSINGYAFHYCSKLTSVTIPSSVIEVVEWAFSDCTGLTAIDVAVDNPAYASEDGVLFNKLKTSLIRYPQGKQDVNYTIPNSVTTIGVNAFVQCARLISIAIPNSVTSIGESAFYDCSGLTSIAIPNSVTSIGYRAFSGCSNLESIVIPNGVTSIEVNTFYGCSGLTTITIPNSVTTIGSCAFWDCSGLTTITIPNSVTSIGSCAFWGCSGLTSITIPSSVTTIEENTFWGCSGLTSITIPSSVTSTERNAFLYCDKLTSVTILATTPPTLGGSNFAQNNVTLYVPTGCVEAYKASAWNGVFTTITEIQ